MKKITRLKEILAGHKQELQDKFKVRQLGIFGSYARNEQKKSSDVDVLVEFSQSPGLFGFMELEEYLAKLLKMKVDLVSKKALKPYIGQYILEEVVYI